MKRLLPPLKSWRVCLSMACLFLLLALLPACTKRSSPLPPVPTGADVVAAIGYKVTRDSEGSLTLTDCEILQVENATETPVVIRTHLVLRAERDCAVLESSFAQGAPMFTPFAVDPLKGSNSKSLRVLKAGESAKFPVRYLCILRPGKLWDLWPKNWEDALEKKPVSIPAVPTEAEVVTSLGSQVSQESEGALTLTDCKILRVEDGRRVPVVIHVHLTVQADRECGVKDAELKKGNLIFTVVSPKTVSDFDRKHLRLLTAGESADFPFRLMCFGHGPHRWTFLGGPLEDKAGAKLPAK